MARPLRVVYEDAMYHVINRGNYRWDVFGSVGAAQAFEAALFETCERYRWELFAFVVMRNHYHLAVATPQANLVEGMHWLQGTFAMRFNRFRSERGHLFQGRYHALLIENAAALSRVVDYVHLNPTRAKIVPINQLRAFRWSSLRRYVGNSTLPFFAADDWLGHLKLKANRDGWNQYLEHLRGLAEDPERQEQLGFKMMSRGWAIGTDGWRKAIAKDHAHRALAPGLSRHALRELHEARWHAALEEAMKRGGKTTSDAQCAPKSSKWKVEIARELRGAGVPCGWIAEHLHMGPVTSMRVYLSRS